jgi:hypothetical protein
MSDDFKSRLVQHARLAVDRAPRALSEAATSQYLVLPFFQFLGYDPLDPDEVVPEAHAAFSEKFKNRVDYAICKASQPVIAVECKRVGALNEGHKGELKGYFNAVPSVKLGILTDGLVWQLYSDTGRENMMDDEPFVMLDLTDVAEGRITESALDALSRLGRDRFDPADVGADARRKLYVAAYLAVLERAFNVPDEALVRTLMDLARIDGRRTGRLIEEHAPVVSEAMHAFLDKKILERVGFAERGDLVRVGQGPSAAGGQPSTASAPAGATGEAALIAAAIEAATGDEAARTSESGVITTETEVTVFDYVRQRLPFLIEREEELFQKLSHLYPRDFKTRFTVCYRQDRNGRLFNFMEMTQGPRFRFEFPDSGVVINTDDLHDIDGELLTTFMRRVAELG